MMNFIDRYLKVALVLLMFSIVATITWQVLTRYIMQTPSPGSEELARFLLIWIGMLGGVYAYRTRAHLGLNLVTEKMSENHKRSVAMFSHVMVFVFSALVLIVGGYNIVMLTLEPVQTSASLQIYMAFVYCVIPISGLLFCYYAVIEFLTLKNMQGEV